MRPPGATATRTLRCTGEPGGDELHTLRGAAIDVTEARQLASALADEKARLQVTLYGIGDAVIATDLQARVNFLNPAAERMLDLPGHEAIGLPLATLLRLVDERSGEPIADPVVACLRSGERTLDDPIAQIRGSYLAALRATVADPQARRVFEVALFKVEHGHALRGVRERRLNGLRNRVEQVERGFRRAARLGLWRSALPARAAALGVESLVDGLITHWMLDPQAFDLVRTGERALDAYLRGLRAGD